MIRSLVVFVAGAFDLGTGRIQITPGTRLRRGKKYMGVDLAQLLDQHYEKTRRPRWRRLALIG